MATTCTIEMNIDYKCYSLGVILWNVSPTMSCIQYYEKEVALQICVSTID